MTPPGSAPDSRLQTISHCIRGRLRRRRRAVPTLLQSQPLDCALAALAMVLSHHGREVSVAELRLQAGDFGHPLAFATLIRLARRHGMAAVLVKRLEPAAIGEQPLPALAHFDLIHMVVVEAIDARRVHINDPLVGPQRLDPEEFDRRFSGMLLLLRPIRSARPRSQPWQLAGAAWRDLRRRLGPGELLASAGFALARQWALLAVILGLLLSLGGAGPGAWPYAVIALLGGVIGYGLDLLRGRQQAAAMAKAATRQRRRALAELRSLAFHHDYCTTATRVGQVTEEAAMARALRGPGSDALWLLWLLPVALMIGAGGLTTPAGSTGPALAALMAAAGATAIAALVTGQLSSRPMQYGRRAALTGSFHQRLAFPDSSRVGLSARGSFGEVVGLEAERLFHLRALQRAWLVLLGMVGMLILTCALLTAAAARQLGLEPDQLAALGAGLLLPALLPVLRLGGEVLPLARLGMAGNRLRDRGQDIPRQPPPAPPQPPPPGQLLLLDGLDDRQAEALAAHWSRIHRGLIPLGSDSRLLGGRLRDLLDPRRQYPDATLVTALKQAAIWTELQSRGGLQASVHHAESQYSGGQLRRLLLARALCGQPRILLLDLTLDMVDLPTCRQILGALTAAGIGVALRSKREDLRALAGEATQELTT